MRIDDQDGSKFRHAHILILQVRASKDEASILGYAIRSFIGRGYQSNSLGRGSVLLAIEVAAGFDREGCIRYS